MRARWLVLLTGAIGLMVAGAMVVPGPRSRDPDHARDRVGGAVGLPSTVPSPRGSESGVLPPTMDGLSACDDAIRDVPCVRWVHPGPTTFLAGQAPVTRTSSSVLVVGSHDQVRGLDAASGHLRWTAPAAGGVAFVRHAAEGIVLVQDAEGVRAIDQHDGLVRWSVEGATILRTRTHGASLPQVLLRSNGRSVTAHDPRDGRVEWRLPDAGMLDTFVPVREGLVLVGTDVVDADDGRRLWEARSPVTEGPAARGAPEHVLGRAPLAAWHDGVLMARGSHDDPTLALREADSGALIAELGVDGARVRRVTLVEDHLVVQTDEELVGYALADGGERWRRDDDRGELLTAPAVTGPFPGLPGVAVPARALALRLPDGTILQIDERTGQPRRRLGTPDPSGLDLGSGLVLDGLLAKVDDDGMQLFDIEDGDMVFSARMPAPEIIMTSPLVVLSGGRLIGVALADDAEQARAPGDVQ